MFVGGVKVYPPMHKKGFTDQGFLVGVFTDQKAGEIISYSSR